MKTIQLHLRYWLVRIFYILFFLSILVGAYLYNVPYFTYKGIIVDNPFYIIVFRLPEWMYTVQYISLIFLVASVLILSLILYYNKVKAVKAKLRENYRTVFVGRMMDYIHSDASSNDESRRSNVVKIKNSLYTDFSKRLFISTLQQIQNQTLGDIKFKAVQLFKDVNLEYFIRAYLKSPFLRYRLFALKVIADFRLEGYDDYIIQLTKSKNVVLRNEAIYTLITLNVYDNLLFLVDMNIQLTMWDINIIIKTMKKLKKQNIHYFPLINSHNPQLNILGIMLARINKRKDLKMDIKNKIGNPNQMVSDEAFLAFISFADTPSDYDFMTSKFECASEYVQIQIIKLIPNCNDVPKTLAFLTYVIERKTYTQKIEAIKLMMELDIRAVSTYANSDNFLVRQSCLQALDINL